jgi:hypothetical protein
MKNYNILKQISVFLENEMGRTSEVTNVLAKKDINILAFNLSGVNDYGLFSFIVDDVPAAEKALKEAHLAVKLTDVISVNCPNKAGALTEILDHLTDGGVSIDYMYAFQYADTSSAIIRPTDMNKCKDVLAKYE